MARGAITDGRTRHGGRAGRRATREKAPLVFLPTLKRNVPVYEIMDAEGEELIHEGTMRILEEIGIEFRDAESLAIWRHAGAEVKGELVRIPRELLMGLVAKTPEIYTHHARNPARSVKIGGPYMAFMPGYTSPRVRDLDDVQRDSTLADLHDFFKLAYMSAPIHITGGVTVEPLDIAVPKRHLHVNYGAIKYSDKPFMGYVTSGARAEDTMAMARIVFGEAFVDSHAVVTSLVNCNSPLVWDQTMLDALKVYARANQAVLCSPFMLAGASTAASTAGSVAQLNAEALAGMAFGQLLRPGSPMVHGSAVFGVSMTSGGPIVGTPELAHVNLMIGQLARRYRIPWRSSASWSGAKLVDAQAGYETIMTMFPVVASGANWVAHSAGFIDGSMTMSFAKHMLDVEHLAMFHEFARGVRYDDLDETIQVLREVGPGGHFLATEHTRRNFFFQPTLLDSNTYEQWLEEGAKDANTRALEAARRLLARYEPPPLDPAIDEALLAYVAKREAELPDEEF